MKNTSEAEINISSEWFILIIRNFIFDWEKTGLLLSDENVEIIYRNGEKALIKIATIKKQIFSYFYKLVSAWMTNFFWLGTFGQEF